MPEPAATVYLKMHPDTSKNLLAQRYGGDEGKKDIHEKNLNYLLACHEAAGYVAEKCGWRVVECCDGQNLLSREEVAKKVIAALSDLFE